VDLILGALIGAAASLVFSLIRDLVQRRWARKDEITKSAKVKSERADQRTEEAAGRIVDLADLLQENFYDRLPSDSADDDGGGTGSPKLTREILGQAARLTNQTARSRIETATYLAGSAEALQWRTGHQLGQIGWRIGREIREVAGAILRNESVPPCSVEDYVEVWELFDQQ
jgi:hypothetical protein